MGATVSVQGSEATQKNTYDQDVPEGNGFIFLDRELPIEMCEEIFLNVPAFDLVVSASRVCKNWHHLLTNISFWFQKIKRDGYHLPATVEKKLSVDIDKGKALHVLQGLCCRHFFPLNTNLICNPSGRDGFNNWQVRHGGDRLKVECPPIGSNPIPEEAGLPTQHCFVSSYTSCSRSQTIKLDLEPLIMDILRPEIWISEWVSARWDCNAKSTINVKIFGRNENPAVYEMNWSSIKDDVVNREWYKISMVADYQDGLSAIKFTNSSSDEQFWAGHYGAKTAGSSVILHL